MEKITFKKLLVLTTIITAGFTTNAQINSTGGWSAIGDVTITNVTDDGDNGDGVADGALFVDGQSSVVGQGAKFTFDGTMESGTNYAIVSNIYNLSGSYSKVRVSLHNETDDTELAVYVDGGSVLNGSNPVEEVTFNYTAVAGDVGDKLALRYVRNDDGNTARNFNIDNASLNGIFVSNTPVSVAGSWSGIGDVIIENVTDDGDNGDGASDGALFVDGQSAVDGQGIKYTFTEKMVVDREYALEAVIYNLGSSYSKVRVSLHNKTDDTELAVYVDGGTVLNGSNQIEAVSFSYTAKTSDADDVLELKFIRNDGGNTARNFSIDYAKINGSTLTTGILNVANEVMRKGVKIFPNPVNNILNLSLLNSEIKIKKIQLVDLMGRVIFKQNSIAPIRVNNFSKGLYLLKMESEEGGLSSKKIIIN